MRENVFSYGSPTWVGNSSLRHLTHRNHGNDGIIFLSLNERNEDEHGWKLSLANSIVYVVPIVGT